MIRTCAALAFLLACIPGAQALAPNPSGNPVKASLVAEPSAAVPGTAMTVGIRLEMRKGWHVYWRNPGDSGMPPEMAWDLPSGVSVGATQWPAPERIPVQDMMNYGYEGEVTLLVPVDVPPGFPDPSLVLAGKLTYLACEEICIPGSADLSLSLPVAAGTTQAPDAASVGMFTKARAALPVASPWPTSLTGSGDRVVLNVDRPGLGSGDVAEANFFPYDDTVLENAGEQVLTVDPKGLRLSLKPSDPAKPPTRLAGVLTLREGGSKRAFVVGENAPATASATPASPPSTSRVEAAADALTLWGASGLAFLGGLVLNLMPCVFPVLSIKVLGLVAQAGQSERRIRMHGVAYTAGVMASFLGLAGMLMGLKAGGAGIGWGFQLQSPVVVALLAYGLAAMALSLSDVVHFGGSIVGLGDGLTRRAGYQGSFFTGVLATLVATPCTAPFMGAAVGFALTQPPAAGLVVFGSLGLGLAMPFLALTLWPGALRSMPRPGAWMDTLKGVLAFPVYATVAWLVWVLSQQVGPNGLLAGLVGLVLVGFAAWTWERARLAGPMGARVARAGALAALVATAGLVAALDADRAAPALVAGKDGVEPFTQARLDVLRGEGRTVFVDMTAAWCITCQVNERTTLSRAAVREAFRANGVTLLRGDWTNRNPEITRLLERHGRDGVPLYLVYKGEAEPAILPQILTEGIVAAAVARPSGVAMRR